MSMPEELAIPNCKRYVEDSLAFLLPTVGCSFYLNNIKVCLTITPDDQLCCGAQVELVKEDDESTD